MSQESARHRASLWLRQAQDDLRAARLLQEGGQAAQACFLAQQVGEKAIKALLAADDRDLRSHSLKALLQELDQAHAQRWQRQAQMLWVMSCLPMCSDPKMAHPPCRQQKNCSIGPRINCSDNAAASGERGSGLHQRLRTWP